MVILKISPLCCTECVRAVDINCKRFILRTFFFFLRITIKITATIFRIRSPTAILTSCSTFLSDVLVIWIIFSYERVKISLRQRAVGFQLLIRDIFSREGDFTNENLLTETRQRTPCYSRIKFAWNLGTQGRSSAAFFAPLVPPRGFCFLEYTTITVSTYAWWHMHMRIIS